MSTRLSKWIFTTVTVFVLGVTLLLGTSFITSAEAEGETNVETDPSAQSTEALQPIVAEDIDFSTLGDPVETWDISATSADNVVAEIYNDPDNSEKYVLKISGDGNMKNWTYSYSPWGTKYNTKISFITISDGVASIGNRSFFACTVLTSIELPSSITSIGCDAFHRCTSLTSIKIPESVTSIGDSAFYDCRSLESIEIPKGVTSIGERVFGSCSSLTSVGIFGNVKSIGSSAFTSCTRIKEVYISSIDAWCRIDFADARSNPLFCGANLILNGEYVIDVVIPNDVENLGDYAFYNCNSITSIKIPDGVTSIGDSAFYNCSSLASIEIPDGVTSIGDYAFYNCSSITSIRIPDGVTSIGGRAFSGCISLTSIEIPDGVTSIGDYAFYNCSSITSIRIPDGVTSIGKEAFSEARIKEVHIGSVDAWCRIAFETLSSNPAHNGSDLFLDGKIVTELIIPKDIGLTSIGNYAFSGCSSLTSVKIPDSVTSIGDSAFSSCGRLISIEISSSVTSIGSSAFRYCSRLRSIDVPNGVTSIGDYTFEDCYYLTTIEIPDGVTSIGVSAFSYCSGLTSIEIPDGVTSIGLSAFSYCSGLTSIKIPDGVTSIGSCVFDGCSGLTSIEIPDGVTSIGEEAFYGCRSLTSIDIPDGVTSIGKYAFYNCSNLTSVRIPSGVKSISNYTFDGCNKLSVIIINSPTIASGIISYSSNGKLTYYAKTIAIRQDITEVGSYVTSNFINITTLNIPIDGETVTYVVYSKHSHEADATTWSEADENGIQTCSICGLKKARHVCQWGEWEISVVPDFENPGLATRVCTLDGAHVEEYILPALNEVDYEYIAPSCDVGGSYTYINDIGIDFVYEVEAAGHRDYIFFDEIPAKCENDGMRAHYKCGYCDKLFDKTADNEYKVIEDASVLVITQLGHDYDYENVEYLWGNNYMSCVAIIPCKHADGDESHYKTVNGSISKSTIEPTCDDPGTTTYTATFSDEKLSMQSILDQITVPALGHYWGEWALVATDKPTMEKGGTILRQCQRNHNHWDEENIPPLTDPDYSVEVKYTATCVDMGLEIYTIVRDGKSASINFIIQPSGHSINEYEWIEKAATCTDPGEIGHYICDNCGKFIDKDGKILDSIVIPAGHDFDYTNPQVEAPTCTTPGYTYVMCTRSGCNVSYQYNFKNPVQHNYKVWTTLIPDTCDTVGQEESICEFCNAKASRPVDEIHHKYKKINDVDYKCVICGDSYYIDDNGKITFENQQLYNCAVDFGFHVIYNGSRADLYQFVEIYDSYFIDSEGNIKDEHKNSAKIKFDIFPKENAVDGKYWITPLTPYSNGNTYVARLASGVSFDIYRGQAIKFTIEKADKSNNSWVINEDVVQFINYFDFKNIQAYDDGICVEIINFATILKSDIPNIGQIVCITRDKNINGLNELLTSTNFEAVSNSVIGRVEGFIETNNNTTVIVLSNVNPEDVFETISISSDIDISLEDIDNQKDEIIKDIADGVKNQLASDDNFKTFLAVIGKEISDWCDDEGLTIGEGDDLFSIIPNITINGNTVTVTVDITVNTHLKKNNTDYGTISVIIKAENEATFDATGYAKLTLLGIYFDASLTAESTTHMKIDIKYTYSDSVEGSIDYVGNPNTKVLHCGDCRYVSMIKNPCSDYTSYGEYIDAGYRDCTVCRPNEYKSGSDRINDELDELLKEGVEYTHWPKTKEKFDEIASHSAFKKALDALSDSVLDANESKGMLLGTVGGVYAGFILRLDAYFVFDFDIEAVVNLEISKTSTVTYGARKTWYGIEYYQEEISESESLDFTIFGELHAKAGIGVDGSITFIDIIGVGVRLEVGVYLDVSGCAHVLIEVDNDGDYSELYGALHIDFGLYYKSYVYLRISKYNIPFIGRAEAHKIPIYVAGPNKVYNMYASDETHITAQEDVTHNSNYIDLSVLKIPVMYIYLGGINDIKDENILKALAEELSLSNFSISIVLEDENLPDSVRLDDYILRFDDSAGKEFSVKLKITCKLQDDSWSKCDGVNSVYMFDEEHILVINVTNNHLYELVECVKGNCVEKAYAIYRCDCCNGEIKEHYEYDASNHSDVNTGNSFVVDIDEKIATCTQVGYSSHRKCSKCGETFGCVETEIDPNNHKWSTTLKTHYYFDNSCEDGGYTYYSCDYGCGEIDIVQKYDSFEHKMTFRVPATNSTCSTQGHEEYYKCAVCGYHTTPSLRPLDPENHTVDNESWEDKTYLEDCKVVVAKYTECIECYNEIILSETITYDHLYIDVPGKEATCDTTGYYAYKECVECGNRDGYKTYGPLGHIKGDIVVDLIDDNDCSAGAITLCWCEKCGAFLEEKLYSTYSHNWCVESGKEPTCDEPGVTEYHYCLRCEQEKGGETIPKLGHDYSWVITRQPTYEQSGSRDYVCNRCEYVSLYNRTIPMLPYTDGLLYSLDYTARTMTIVGVDVTVFNGSEILVPPIFEGCDVTKIGANAFLNAPNLKNLTIPSSITKINSLAFENCVALENLYYKGTLSDYLNIEFSGNEPMGFENLYIGSITGALVEALNFSKDVDVINEFAFAGFTSIKSVIIDKNMTVGAYAFYNCTELNELKLNVSDGEVYVLEGAFKNTAITTLTLDTCVSEISSFAFDGIPIQFLIIKNADIVSAIKERNDTVESSFEGLISVLNIPETVLIDSELDFVDLSDIFEYSDLIISENEAYYVYSKHSHLVDSGFWVVNGNGSSHSCSICGIEQLHTESDVWEVTIESTFGHVGERVIRCLACNKITKTDEIPCLPYTDGLQYQLSDCGSHYTVVGVGISKDTHINIPPTYKSLPVSAINFDGFETVNSIEFGTTINEFKGFGRGINLYISDISAYCSIKTEEYGVGGTYRDIYLNGEKIVNLVIPKDVEVINSDLFSYLISIESVVVSEGVTTIREWTFAMCKQLRRVEIAENVIEIGASAFQGCENLTFVIICSPNIASNISHYTEKNTYGQLIANADTIYIPKEIEDVSDYIMTWHGPESEVTLSGRNYITYSHSWHKWEKVETLVSHIQCMQDEISLLRCEYCIAEKETITIAKHTYIVSIKNATCLESGYTTYICQCGDSYITDYQEPVGHYEIHHASKEATCTEYGWEAYVTCGRNICDYSTYVIIPATGHDYGVWVQILAPKCEVVGTERRDCAKCDHYETEDVKATGHKPADAVVENCVEPNCTTDGKYDSVVYCSVCNVELSRDTVVIDKLGHNFASEWTVDVEPTCTTAGSKSHHCSSCEEKSDVTEIPANEHKYGEWFVVSLPTYIEAGINRRDCDTCDHYELEVVKANVIPFTPKTSITLGSELVYNVYVPVVDYLKSFTVDGKIYENLIPVTLDDGNQYYHIAVSMPASEAARNVVLKASITIDGKEYTGTWTMSIPKYAAKVIETSKSNEEITLVKDVLSYIRAAYAYFDTVDVEAIAKIDAILGKNYDDNNAPALNGSAEEPTTGLKSATYILDATPAIRFHITGEAGAYAFYVNGVKLKTKEGTDEIGTYLEMDVYAYAMGETITYTINGVESGSYHINCYYTFVTTDAAYKDNAELINLVARFAKYCESAAAYRNSVINKQ